jgi:hypothetical protein
MVHQSTKRMYGLAKWWAFTSDVPEVLPLYVAVAAGVSLAAYTLTRTYRADQGVFWNKDIRRDMWQQAEGRLAENHTGETSLLHKMASVKVDKDGYQVGIFNNRMRPFEYNKSGPSTHVPVTPDHP